MEQHTIPDFMQEYYQASNLEGKQHIEKLAGQYSEERAVFLQTVFVSKQEFLRDWNRLTGQKKALTANEALAPMREEYSEKAKSLAIKHGYQDQEAKTQEEPHIKDEQQTINLNSEKEAFLSNLKSMRDRQASQQARLR